MLLKSSGGIAAGSWWLPSLRELEIVQIYCWYSVIYCRVYFFLSLDSCLVMFLDFFPSCSIFGPCFLTLRIISEKHCF